MMLIGQSQVPESVVLKKRNLLEIIAGDSLFPVSTIQHSIEIIIDF